MSVVNAVGQLRRRGGAPGPAAAEVVYLGGVFNGVNAVWGATRNRAAAVDADVDADTDAIVEAWNPDCGGTVRTMVLNEADMYLGGEFTTVGVETRNRAACVDSDPAAANPDLRNWNPDCSGTVSTVNTMLLSGDDMYLGGGFTFVRAEPRNRAACVDSNPAAADPPLRHWNPNTDNAIYTMVLDGADMYLGGLFTSVGGQTRNNAACVDSDPAATNPTVRPWHPDCNSWVTTMLLDGADMYLGGVFTTIRGGTTRNRAACVDSDVTQANPTLRAWNPNCNNAVWTMVLNGADMYLGGTFTTISDQQRTYAACVDSDVTQANPTLRAWNPNCSSLVYTMVLDGADMYLGGQFITVGTETRNRAACVDRDVTQVNPTLRAWNPNCNDIVHTMVLA